MPTIAETLSILTKNSELSNLLEKDKFEIISAKTYNAVGDNVVDDSDAVLAGLAYVKANGLGSYYFPHGIYKVDPARFTASTFSGIYLWGDNSSFDGISDTIYQIGVAVVTPDSVLTTSILDKAVTSPKFADDVQVGSLTLLNALITGAARASVTAAINKVVDIISADIIATQTGSYTYAATATGNDTYVVTLSPVPAAYVEGMTLNIKVDVGNTGAATLNVNSKGAIALAKMTSTGVAALVTGDMIANGTYSVIYTVISATPYFLVLNPTGANVPTSIFEAAGDIIVASGANTPARLGKGAAYSAVISNGTTVEYGYPLTSYYYANNTITIHDSPQEYNQFYDGNGTYWRSFATFSVNRLGRIRVVCDAKNTTGGGRIKVVGSISGDMCSILSTTGTYATYTMDFNKDIVLGETLYLYLEGSAGWSAFVKNVYVKAGIAVASESLSRSGTPT